MDESKIAELALSVGPHRSPVELAKIAYRVLFELEKLGLDTRSHPAARVVAHGVCRGMDDVESEVFDQLQELAKGKRTIEIPVTLKFSSDKAADQFRDAARIYGEAGGEVAQSFERCVESLVRLKATVGPDTDADRYPEEGYSYFGWSGCGMIGAMVRHRSDGLWSLHS